MCGVLAILFIAVPAAEIYTLILVGNEIGALATLGIIVATGVLGAALARHQGLHAVREVQRSLLAGSRVGRAMVEAALVLAASVMLLTPGFFTDAFGFSLLLPPIRRVIANIVVARFATRITRMTVDGLADIPSGAPPWQARGFVSRERGQGSPERDRARSERDRGSDDDHEPPPPGVIDV